MGNTYGEGTISIGIIQFYQFPLFLSETRCSCCWGGCVAVHSLRVSGTTGLGSSEQHCLGFLSWACRWDKDSSQDNWDIYTPWEAGNEHSRWPEVFLLTASVTFYTMWDNSASAPGTEPRKSGPSFSINIFWVLQQVSLGDIFDSGTWPLKAGALGFVAPETQVAVVPHSSVGKIKPVSALQAATVSPWSLLER